MAAKEKKRASKNTDNKNNDFAWVVIEIGYHICIKKVSGEFVIMFAFDVTCEREIFFSGMKFNFTGFIGVQ